MTVRIEIDEAHCRATAVVPGGVRWATFETAALAALNRAPALADWNWIIDDQGPMDDVDVEGMMRIGKAFRHLQRQSPASSHTVVVTRDRFFPDWAKVMDQYYGGRRHHPAPTRAAAVVLIEQLDDVERASGV